jgi:hypothetical protein
MKMHRALLCCLTIAFAPLAAAQTQKPAATPPTPAPGVRPVIELRKDTRRESCEKQAADQKLRGGALEIFMTKCLG